MDGPFEEASDLVHERATALGRYKTIPIMPDEDNIWRYGAMTDHENEERLEEARKKISALLAELRSSGTLTQKECDAVEAAIEDELIALRVAPLLNPKPN